MQACGNVFFFCFFFFNDTATTEIYTLSLHDALPILGAQHDHDLVRQLAELLARVIVDRSEEHTSELQSRQYLVCRLLLEKKNITVHFVYNAFYETPPYLLSLILVAHFVVLNYKFNFY